MKNTLALTTFTLVLGLSNVLTAKEASSADRAARLLDAYGTIPIKAAGPYVEVGTYQVQVANKLGRPTAVLADGTWLYDRYSVPNSAARGALVVRFRQGQVSDLSLATPAVVAAIQANPRGIEANTLISKK